MIEKEIRIPIPVWSMVGLGPKKLSNSSPTSYSHISLLLLSYNQIQLYYLDVSTRLAWSIFVILFEHFNKMQTGNKDFETGINLFQSNNSSGQ
jgi:hypothetical protein